MQGNVLATLPDAGNGLFVPFLIQEITTINNTAKIILAQIAALGDCVATDNEIGELLGLSSKTVSNNLTGLKNASLVETYRKEGRRVMVANVTTSNRGTWIPAAALTDPGLSVTDKLLLGHINSLANSQKGCIASNFWLAKVVGVTVGRVKNILTRLRSLGWVKSIENAGKRLLAIAKEIAKLPEKNTCTSRKSDGLHSIKIKRKTLLPAGEKTPLSINEKIESVIEKTGWLKKQAIDKGLNFKALAAELLQSGFQWVGENAARSYLKDFIARRAVALDVSKHPAAGPIAERYRQFFGAAPSLPQLAKLLDAADVYGVHRVRYAINIIGVGHDAGQFNAGSVVNFLQKNYKA